MVVNNPTLYQRVLAAKQANVSEHQAAWQACMSWFSYSKGDEFAEVPPELEPHVELLKQKYSGVANTV